MSYLIFISIFLTVLISTSAYVQPGSRLQAAMCIRDWTGCSPETARRSTACVSGRMPRDQPKLCLLRGCEFCEWFGYSNPNPCSNWRVKYACQTLLGKKKKNNPPAPTNKGGSCVWTGMSDSIVIDLSKVSIPYGWSRVSRGGYNGLVYERNKNHGIDPAGRKGKMCFKVRAKYSGSYFLTAISYAPHWTEYNDCWASSSKGFRHYQGGRMFTSAPGQWKKAYQNRGPNGISGDMFTKDHDAHIFIIPNVIAGEVFNVCIAGRSYRYEMFRLILVSCKGQAACRHGSVMNMPVSPCM